METTNDKIAKILYPGSPFLPRTTPMFSMSVEQGIAQGLARPLVMSWNLRELFLRHVNLLEANLSSLAEIRIESDDLTNYKYGLMIPIAIIQGSVQEMGGIGDFYQRKYGLSQDCAEFIDTKVVECDKLRENRRPWKDVIHLADEFNNSIFFKVGVTACEYSFVPLMDTTLSE